MNITPLCSSSFNSPKLYLKKSKIAISWSHFFETIALKLVFLKYFGKYIEEEN